MTAIAGEGCMDGRLENVTIAIHGALRKLRRGMAWVEHERGVRAAHDRRIGPSMWALGAALAVLGWLALTVQANYAGNWSGLFRTGQTMRVPDRLAPGTLRDPSPLGYDGQFYRFIAHDPFLQQGTPAYLDVPLLRSYRILVPLLAWILAGGRQGLIDGAFVLVVTASVFGGVYWLACAMVRLGRNAAWGLWFLALPGVIASVDRMTVDVALAALTACFAWQQVARRERGQWFVLAAASLVRETGIVLVAAAVFSALLQRQFRKAAIWAAAALPAVCWLGYLRSVLPTLTAEVQHLTDHYRARGGIVVTALHPPRYGLAPPLETMARALDSLALAAVIAALIMGVLLLRRIQPGALRWTLGLNVGLLLALTDPGFWTDPFGYGRLVTPLFLLLQVGAGPGPAIGWLLRATFLSVLLDARLFVEIKSQVAGILNWLPHALR
jgi:hypothetical protein